MYSQGVREQIKKKIGVQAIKKVGNHCPTTAFFLLSQKLF